MSKPDYNIRAEELRIGNWVNYLMGGDCQIENGREIDAFEKNTPTPIQLTPEILEKAGFKKEKYSYFTDWVHWLDGYGFSLKYTVHNNTKKPNEFVIYGNGGYDDAGERDILKTCQYVHQLQNLYFTLTGEELQIDLIKK